MSCENGHCACDHDTDAPDAVGDRHLPTVNDERPAGRESGCCGGQHHAERSAPTPNPTR